MADYTKEDIEAMSGVQPRVRELLIDLVERVEELEGDA